MAVYCNYCNKLFSSHTNLNKHRKNIHNLASAIKSYKTNGCKWSHKCLEENCVATFRKNDELLSHLKENHEFVIDTEIKEFGNLEAFKYWKEEMENTEQCSYYLSRSYTVSTGEKIIYMCNRSGKQPSYLGRKKRFTKSQGSCKINSSCISRLIVTKKINKVIVNQIKTHYGHKMELQHLRISKQNRNLIASKLLMGVSKTNVLDDVRDHIGRENVVKRVDLLTKQDVVNIGKSFKLEIKEGVRHKIDSISIDMWVEECISSNNENCPILLYKKQGCENEYFEKSDFCLIIMNSYQELIFNKFGSNIIAIDSTHGLNNYDFELTTIMVIDDSHEGFPVSYMFTNRKDTYINKIFFDTIKDKTGIVKCNTFMSDITGIFYDAWVCVMGTVSKQLYCSWHIDRAWRSNLSKIPDKQKRTQVYKTLKYLQHALDEDTFLTELHNFMKCLLQDKDTTKFGFYFQTYYSKNINCWAYCFRKSCGINTNMYLESMHKTIKYFYLSGRKVKRLDKGLHAVLKYTRDKVVDRLIKYTKGKNSSAKREILRRHKTSLISKFEVKSIDDCKWLLKSNNNNTEYVIQKNITVGKCCSLRCQECDICIHVYTCNCPDFFIKSTICKHIHYIAKNQNLNIAQLSPPLELLPPVEEKSILNTLNLNLNNGIAMSNKEDIIANIQKKSTFLFSNLLNLDTENLSHIETQFTELKSYVQSVLKNTFKSVTDSPNLSNQKIEKQKNFMSTKKKTKKKDSLKKPTYVEKQKIQSILSGHLIDHDYL